MSLFETLAQAIRPANDQLKLIINEDFLNEIKFLYEKIKSLDEQTKDLDGRIKKLESKT